MNRAFCHGTGAMKEASSPFRLEAITGGTRLILEHTGLKGMRGLALAWVLSHGWARKIDRRLPAVLACAASEQTRYEDRLRH